MDDNQSSTKHFCFYSILESNRKIKYEVCYSKVRNPQHCCIQYFHAEKCSNIFLWKKEIQYIVLANSNQRLLPFLASPVSMVGNSNFRSSIFRYFDISIFPSFKKIDRDRIPLVDLLKRSTASKLFSLIF